MKTCYCCSSQTYDRCCQPYHQGLKIAETPEILMRSRYSAYYIANIYYIQATMRGKASENFDPVTAKLWAQRVIWIKLQIINADKPLTTQGHVEFIATFVDNKTVCQMHENSEFQHMESRWFYVDGKPGSAHPKITDETLSRNTACPCGSLKKWKHCHGKNSRY